MRLPVKPRWPLLALAAALLATGPSLAQPLPDAPPNVFERYEAKRKQNPALDQKLQAAVEVMKKVAFMAGRWDVTEKRFGTRTTPEKVETGTREATLDLDGRCLVTRQTIGPLETLDLFLYDPYQGYWFRQMVTNSGRGAFQPLASQTGWDGPSLTLSGVLWVFGEQAEVLLRITKESDDAFIETLEEKLRGNVYRPILEWRCRRAAPAAAAGKAPAAAPKAAPKQKPKG